MLAHVTRGGMAILLCAAIGCQELHEASKYDPLIWRKSPNPGPENAIAASAPSGAVTATSRSAAPNSDISLHYVSYAPVDSGSPTGGASGEPATTTSLGPEPGQGASGLLSASQNSRAPKSKWSDALVVRGQTPLRQVFASDRAVLAGIIIAAIVIPFAIHDSREANPPLQFR